VNKLPISRPVVTKELVDDLRKELKEIQKRVLRVSRKFERLHEDAPSAR